MLEVLVIPGERSFGIRGTYPLPSHLLLIQLDDVVAELLSRGRIRRECQHIVLQLIVFP